MIEEIELEKKIKEYLHGRRISETKKEILYQEMNTMKHIDQSNEDEVLFDRVIKKTEKEEEKI